VLKDAAGYEMIGTSVTETSWIDRVTKDGNSGFLLIAEGLFMWLPQQENARIFKKIGEKFINSQIVLDMVPEKYTRGIWKSLIRLHSRLDWGLDVAWESGIEKAQDIEAYSPGIKVIAEQKGTTGPIITAAINVAD
jgi:O-methyltransferase involved in polyketide biosynthesis